MHLVARTPFGSLISGLLVRGNPFPMGILKLVDRYILAEWLKVLTLMLGVTLGLLFLEDMYSSFGRLIEYEAGLREILRYYGTLAPSFLPVVLPLSLLLSLLYIMGQFQRNNEFVALRSNGFSLFRITWTIWVAGILFSALYLFFNARLVPWSVEQSRVLRERIEFAHQAEAGEGERAGVTRNVAFDNRRDGRIWFMNRYSAFAERGFGVTVSVLDEEQRVVRRVMAREAEFDEDRGHWIFRDGRDITFDPETRWAVRSPVFDELAVESFTESPHFMLLLDRRPRDLSLFELREVLEFFADSNGPERNQYAVQYHDILAGALSCLIVVGIAIPFSVTGVRVNPMIGVLKSIGLFLAYFLMHNTTRLLGEREIMDPALSAWLPNALMLAVALWLFHRAN